jgi:NAD(P)-dependent dehydrogenase (short-subunit alcohol dehydrogenase family)
VNPDGSFTQRSLSVIAKTPMKRFGKMEELNGTIIYLCSEAASFVTGIVIPVDGGFSSYSGI